MLTRFRARRLGFNRARHNFDYWSRKEPYQETGRTLGLVEFSILRQALSCSTLFVRGWIFDTKEKIETLQLSLNESSLWISAVHSLHRKDVGLQFLSFPQALSSGFAATIDLSSPETPPALLFRYATSSGGLVTARLGLATISEEVRLPQLPPDGTRPEEQINCTSLVVVVSPYATFTQGRSTLLAILASAHRSGGAATVFAQPDVLHGINRISLDGVASDCRPTAVCYSLDTLDQQLARISALASLIVFIAPSRDTFPTRILNRLLTLPHRPQIAWVTESIRRATLQPWHYGSVTVVTPQDFHCILK